jgi:hypothetical protein
MNPELSIVIAARNDDWGGRFLDRMQRFIDVTSWQMEQHAASAELIVVEWNPPADRPRLLDGLKWRKGAGEIRIIHVPAIVHDRLPGSDRMQMFEYIAKNVGIRRARGRHILATNPDVVFSHGLAAELFAAGRLDDNSVYRVDRYDFRRVDTSALEPSEIPRFVSKRVFQVYVRSRTKPINWLRKHYGLWTGRWRGSREKFSGSTRDRNSVIYPGPHLNACGDFALAPSEAWHAIRGYPEFTDVFTHVDSYGLTQLLSLGLDQRIFLPPCMLFHEDHDRAGQAARPKYRWDRVERDLSDIMAGRLGPALNDANWGLCSERLEEVRVA